MNAEAETRGARPRRRTAARAAAVQALYQSEHAGISAETVIDEFVRHRLGSPPGTGGFEEGRVPDADVPLFARIVRLAATHGDTLDAMIANNLAADWPLARLDPVLRAVLRAGAAELHDGTGAPAKVIINEYLDVVHGFLAGEEPGVANAVLEKLARLLRPDEFTTG
jgi:transcription antitermination protein NusB